MSSQSSPPSKRIADLQSKLGGINLSQALLPPEQRSPDGHHQPGLLRSPVRSSTSISTSTSTSTSTVKSPVLQHATLHRPGATSGNRSKGKPRRKFVNDAASSSTTTTSTSTSTSTSIVSWTSINDIHDSMLFMILSFLPGYELAETGTRISKRFYYVIDCSRDSIDDDRDRDRDRDGNGNGNGNDGGEEDGSLLQQVLELIRCGGGGGGGDSHRHVLERMRHAYASVSSSSSSSSSSSAAAAAANRRRFSLPRPSPTRQYSLYRLCLYNELGPGPYYRCIKAIEAATPPLDDDNNNVDANDDRRDALQHHRTRHLQYPRSFKQYYRLVFGLNPDDMRSGRRARAWREREKQQQRHDGGGVSHQQQHQLRQQHQHGGWISSLMAAVVVAVVAGGVMVMYR